MAGPPKKNRAIKANSVVTVVFIERVIVCSKLVLTMSANRPPRYSRIFSLMRSKMTTESFIE